MKDDIDGGDWNDDFGICLVASSDEIMLIMALMVMMVQFGDNTD
jgi:hypothetical protein